MNWFKNKLNKLLDSNIDEEDYYEDELNETYPLTNEKEDRIKEAQIENKKSFKFPLIDDGERFLNGHFSENAADDSTIGSLKASEKTSNYFYQPNAISEVYDVEVSGIRELLANRNKNKGSRRKSSINHSNSKLPRFERPIQQRFNEEIGEVRSSKKKRIVEENVPITQRRFIPTQVPSPVHGFKRPSNINDLINKKHIRDGQLVEVSIKKESEENVNVPTSVEPSTEKSFEEFNKVDKEIASTVESTMIVKDSHLAPLAETNINHQIPNEQQFEEKEVNEPIEKIEESLNITKSFIQENDFNENITLELENAEFESDLVNVGSTSNEDEIIGLEDTSNYLEVETDLVSEIIEEFSVQNKINEENSGSQHNIEKLANSQVQRLVDIALSDVEQEEVEVVEEGTTNIVQNNVEVPEKVEVSDKVNPLLTRNTLPFNVLMLKSDKEKYAKRLAQNELLQHKVDMNGKNRETKESNLQGEEVPQNTVGPDFIEERELLDSHTVASPEIEEQTLDQQKEVPSINKEVMMTDASKSDEEEDSDNSVTTALKNVESNEQQEVKIKKIYSKPSMEFLLPPEEKTEDRDWLESQADVLVESLSYFQVTAQVESIMQGPAVTQFEITVGHGTKVSKIRNLADDLKLALAAKDIRIQAPIPGKSSIGIEIPNRISRAVRLSEVTNSESFLESDSPLEAALGLDLTGKPVTIDLRKMPHGLIAGATGSGKSVCINSVLVSLLYKADPNELKLMLIDPKMVELAPFNHIPHLVSPVITDVKAATAALKWAVEEMERRYQLFAHAGVRDLSRFNRLAESNGQYGHKLPYILIVIDELADLMMMSPADVEEAICRIAQKARACGIHLIVATQRPSVDVITGLIKSNIPTRIAFAVSSQIDSRTILDSQGAERLLGRGDMLYLGNGMSDPIRLQGTFVTDDEIEEIIEHVRSQGEPEYFFQQDELLKKAEILEEQDELFEEVCRYVYEQGSASTSSIQRKYHIGYNRAARLIDMLENHGFISEQRGSKPREVFITDSDLASMFE